jgi:thymidylate synthase (FAD)
MSKISILDAGYVRLADHMGSDLSVVRAARVSYDAEWRTGEDAGKDKKLINYLWKNAHTSPFESVSFTFEVKAPIFVLRQWHRHRTWSYNEVSARYSELGAEYYTPTMESIGKQSGSNKQMRDMVELSSEEIATKVEEIAFYQQHCSDAFSKYHSLIEVGWPRELARMVLPMSTYSHMFATVNMLNLFKFLKLRLHEHAQYEIRVYAEAMLQLITPIVPVCVEAFNNA